MTLVLFGYEMGPFQKLTEKIPDVYSFFLATFTIIGLTVLLHVICYMVIRPSFRTARTVCLVLVRVSMSSIAVYGATVYYSDKV